MSWSSGEALAKTSRRFTASSTTAASSTDGRDDSALRPATAPATGADAGMRAGAGAGVGVVRVRVRVVVIGRLRRGRAGA